MGRVNWDYRTGPSRLYGYAAAQPSWVTRWALIAMVLIVVVPLALLTLAAVLVGFVVFVTLRLVAVVIASVRGAFGQHAPEDEGRENVEVNDRD
jgi:hypothetical protein